MLQFYWPKIRHDPKRLPTEKGKNQNGGTLSFLGKTVFLAKMILKVLTLRLFWGLRSLNFKTFKTLVLDQVLKVLTLRLPSCPTASITAFITSRTDIGLSSRTASLEPIAFSKSFDIPRWQTK